MSAFARRFPRVAQAWQRTRSSPAAATATKVWSRRRPILFGLGVTYFAANYAVVRRDAYLRDFIHPDTYLVWKLYDGAVVECKGPPSLSALIAAPSSGEDVPRVMELFEAVRSLKSAAQDARIRGLVIDFSSLHIPASVRTEPLGLAQIEELSQAIHEFRIAKNEQFAAACEYDVEDNRTAISGPNPHAPSQSSHAALEAPPNPVPAGDAEEGGEGQQQQPAAGDHGDLKAIVLKPRRGKRGSGPGSSDGEASRGLSRPTAGGHAGAKDGDDDDEYAEALLDAELPSTIAITDTFASQSAYCLASACEEVFVQPSGAVPLVGVSAQLPFVKRLLDWLGVKMHAEARKDYKSMISTFTEEESLPPLQLQNEAELLGQLNHGLAYSIGVSRFPDMEPEEAARHVMQLAEKGPYTAKEAQELGLCKVAYKREVLKMLGKHRKYKTFPQYARIYDQGAKKLSADERAEVAVVYLIGTISSSPGEFSASSAIKGLKQAAEDDKVKSIILRIDSGGGDVVASDSLWDAVRRAQEAGKVVVASYGNVSASGGYYASCGADAIVASESTITGSIGVAALRPTVSGRRFADRLGVSIQSLFTGSKENSVFHELEDKERNSRNIDETYDAFLDKVCEGRSISRERLEELAGGRVWTGLGAWVQCNPEERVVVQSGRRSSFSEVAGTAEAKQGEAADAPPPVGLAGDEGGDGGKQPEAAAAAAAAAAGKVVQASTLRSVWRAVTTTKGDEMPTARIELDEVATRARRSPSSKPSDGTTTVVDVADATAESIAHALGTAVAETVAQGQPADGEAAELAALAKEVAAAATDGESSASAPPPPPPSPPTTAGAASAAAEQKVAAPQREVKASSVNEQRGRAGEGDAGTLSAADLEELAELFESSLADGTGAEGDSTSAEKAKEALMASIDQKPLGPYGRGLVDSIGGLWEAALLVMNLEINEEIVRLVLQEGMTLEQAAASVRPGASRTVAEDGSVSLSTDVKLVRYPKEPGSFFERVRELNRKGDQPNLSLSLLAPWLSALGSDVANMVQRAAVRLLVGTWSDPEAIHRLVRLVEEQHRGSSLGGGVRAECATASGVRV